MSDIVQSIIQILNELIIEAKKNPDWKAEQALKCAKKEISKVKQDD